MSNKRFYWLKLEAKFFNDKKIKKMRTLPGGDSLLIVYLKMLTLALGEGGNLIYEGLEDTFEKELALELGEKQEHVKATMTYLRHVGMLELKVFEEVEGYAEAFLYQVPELTGSETASTRRSRKSRNQGKLVSNQSKALQCNTSATPTQQLRNTEIEIDIDKEIDIDIDNRLRSNNNDDLEIYLSSKNIKSSSSKNVLNALKEVNGDINYLEEKVQLTEIKTAGGIAKNVGFLIKAIQGNWKAETKTVVNNPKKTKFHNFKESSRDFTDEELNRNFISNLNLRG